MVIAPLFKAVVLIVEMLSEAVLQIDATHFSVEVFSVFMVFFFPLFI